MSAAPQTGLPSLLMQAAQSAAEADGLVTANTAGAGTQSSSHARRGSGDDTAAAAALAMVAAGKDADKSKGPAAGVPASAGAAALEFARSAFVAAQQKNDGASATTNGPAVAPSTGRPTAMASSAQQRQRQQQLQPQNAAMSAGSAAHMLAAAAATAPQAAAPPPAKMVMPQSAPAPTASSGGGKKKGPPLRRGKWTAEEEAYANRLILEFKAGLLPLTDGTTLRTFLSKLLNCDPMRISKKFVGNNCIGKQVFRRRTADINRLTPEQIQQSRAELSDLERRFLERVAQTNRVKSSGVGSGSGGGSGNASGSSQSNASRARTEESDSKGGSSPPSPPWLRPPAGYKPGTGAATAAAALSGNNNRAAAAGRALLQGDGNGSSAKSGLGERKPSKTGLGSSTSHGSQGLLAMAELQRRALANRGSAGNLLAAAAAAGGTSGSGLSGTAMEQMARNASAARIAGMAAAGNSVNNLMLKTGLSRDQLSQLARDKQLASSFSLSNMMERQSSFDALMSLDFQSLQSIDNLANLIQTGGNAAAPGQVPNGGMKNWDGGSGNASKGGGGKANESSGNLSSLANARRLASVGRMESLIRSLSSGNVANKASGSSGNANANASGNASGNSNANFNTLLQNMQSSLGEAGNSANSLFGAAGNQTASALNLANMLRADSSTGLTALRMQDGLAQRNTSVDDFLSLVASGDIPHQDPHMLNVPLQNMMQQQQAAAAAAAAANSAGGQSGAQAAATYLAQQQLLAQAANGGNQAFNALAAQVSLGNLGNNSAASLLNQLTAGAGTGTGGQGSSGSNATATAFAQQQQQARAAQMNAFAAATTQNNDSSANLKRKLLEMGGNISGQGSSKR